MVRRELSGSGLNAMMTHHQSSRFQVAKSSEACVIGREHRVADYVWIFRECIYATVVIDIIIKYHISSDFRNYQLRTLPIL